MSNLYPTEITIEDEVLKYMKKHSDLIDILVDNEGGTDSLTIDSKNLFGGDEKRWKIFLDLFFPEMGYGKLFNIDGDRVTVRESRGGEEAVMDILKYMMVDKPGEELEFAKIQAKKAINAPAITVARGEGVAGPGIGARQFAARQAFMAARNPQSNNWGNNNNTAFGYEGDENENNNRGVKLGYTEEEENIRSKLPNKYKGFMPNQRRGRRSNRRTRRNKSRRNNRKNRKQTRRTNRK